MLSASCSGLIILLIFGKTTGDSVTQTADLIVLPEGAPLTLNCTYQTSYSAFLFWRGFPDRRLQHFHCSVMILLFIPVLEMIFTARDARAQSVTQPQVHVSISEGASLELRCNHSFGGITYLYWYVQYPSRGLQLLLRYFSGDTLVKGINDFEAEFRKNESSFNLRKPSIHWRDSAEYFCAVSDTVPGPVGGAEHKPHETRRRTGTEERLLSVPEASAFERVWILTRLQLGVLSPQCGGAQGLAGAGDWIWNHDMARRVLLFIHHFLFQ
nr:uncharacterized protein LOC101434079 [Dasypus novemcinctus]